MNSLSISSFSKALKCSVGLAAFSAITLLVNLNPAFSADLPEYHPPKPDTGPAEPPQACVKPDPAGVAISPSLVVHDQGTLRNGFELSKTLGAILRSANLPDGQSEKEAFLKTLLDSLSITEATNSRSKLRMKVRARLDESQMSPADLLNPASSRGLVPIGLFNRLDLAPKSWSDCGEHRIVYSFKGQSNGRFFLIFEAKLPNPDAVGKQPGQMVDPKACVDVAKFWTGLSAMPSVVDRSAALQKFYYEGLPGSTGPVVTATNYGDPLGQVRGNQFVGAPWMLREWRVQASSAPGKMEFAVDTVKSNPLAELYSDNVSDALDPGTQEMVRQNFQRQLLSKYVKEVVAVDGKPGVTASNIINGFAIESDIREFDEFQSESQGLPSPDVPNPSASLLASMVQALPANVQVNGDELKQRLTAITCHGCHDQARGSVGRLNGQEIQWPSEDPFTFVHIHEPGNTNPGTVSRLSKALNTQLLPARQQFLVESHCPDPARQAPLPQGTVAAIPALESELSVLRGAEAAPGFEVMQDIENARESIRRASETEPGFFVDVRRPH